MKNKQKYVVKCIKKISGKKALLGTKIYHPNDYVTPEGNPTKDINLAAIYLSPDDFPFDDPTGEFGEANLSDFFIAEPCMIQSVGGPQYFVAMIRSSSSGGQIDETTMRIFLDKEQAEKYKEELEKSERESSGVLMSPAVIFCELYSDKKPNPLNNIATVRIG